MKLLQTVMLTSLAISLTGCNLDDDSDMPYNDGYHSTARYAAPVNAPYGSGYYSSGSAQVGPVPAFRNPPANGSRSTQSPQTVMPRRVVPVDSGYRSSQSPAGPRHHADGYGSTQSQPPAAVLPPADSDGYGSSGSTGMMVQPQPPTTVYDNHPLQPANLPR